VKSLSEFLDSVWYARHPAVVVLAPIAWVYRGVVALRRIAYSSGLLSSFKADIPVVVVGNISTGGTGKTPLVIWLVEYFRSLGYTPGVVARGYRGRAKVWPQQVRADSDPAVVGDESIVIARRARCPVAVGPRRGEAVDALLRHAACDIVISDDGLQHYSLERNYEIAVIDGVRRMGNGRCLPAGPLREPVARLRTVDLIVTNGIAARGEFGMTYVATHVHKLGDGEKIEIEKFTPRAVHAVAGIGNPERFFAMLRAKGFTIKQHPFRDHVRYRKSDLEFGDDLPIIMTEKDAVKCEHLRVSQCWYIPITAELPEVFRRRLSTAFSGVEHG
jgi:tetraacyldisaccharide 4'-kinase